MHSPPPQDFHLHAHWHPEDHCGHSPCYPAYRPQCPIIAITVDQKACRQLNLAFGVHPVYAEKKSNTDELFLYAIEKALETGVVKKGDKVIITGASFIGDAVTDTIKLHDIN